MFVALADNQHQGIIPVSATLGNGEDPEHNLYWGAAFGVKTFFNRSHDWKLLATIENPKPFILQRCIFKHAVNDVYLIADAYRGDQIRQTITDFLDASAGTKEENISLPGNRRQPVLAGAGGADLLAYVGHDGLMDFELSAVPKGVKGSKRSAIILACASKPYFTSALRESGAVPVLWTTGLMAPEAYTLKSAIDGWMANESNAQIHERAAVAYDKYQKCGLRAARKLFATGWQ